MKKKTPAEPTIELNDTSLEFPHTPSMYKQAFDEQLPIIKAAQKGDPNALRQLEKITYRLRKAKAQKFLPNRYDLHEDAIQVGWTGILKALPKWKPSWNRLFLAYAHWDVSEAVRNFKHEMEYTVHRPNHLFRKLTKLAKAENSDRGGEDETKNWTTKSLASVIALRKGDVSLHEMQFERDTDIGNTIDPSQLEVFENPVRAAMRADMLELLEKSTEVLDDREAHILKLYYETDSTFTQISETMCVSRQRVEQIHSAAITKLQKYFLSTDPTLPIHVRGKCEHSKTAPKNNKLARAKYATA